jgi:hypothetical protein
MHYTVYANFNAEHCTSIANNAQATVLAHADTLDAAIAIADTYEDTAKGIAVVYNAEGEAYYTVN